MRAKAIHRTSAILLGTFILTHLLVHLTALAGAEAHLATLDFVQVIYRNPIGEAILVLSIITQIITGASRLRFRGIGGWALLQVISGLYLIFFLIIHTSAALMTHNVFGIETDFYWAAGSLYYPGIRIGFAIYYLAAVAAIFTHLAAALHFGWPNASKALVRSLPWVGIGLGALIVATFAGVFYTIELSDEAAGYYIQNFGDLPER